MQSERQPSRGRDEWTAEIQAWKASGQSKKAYCKANGISLSSLYNWVSKLNQAQAPHEPVNADQATANNAGFVRLTNAPLTTRSSAFTLSLGNNAQLSWQGEASPTYIAALKKALQS